MQAGCDQLPEPAECCRVCWNISALMMSNAEMIARQAWWACLLRASAEEYNKDAPADAKMCAAVTLTDNR